MTNKITIEMNYRFFLLLDSSNKDFKNNYLSWLKSLKMYFWKLTWVFFLVYLIINVFGFFSISSILASLVADKFSSSSMFKNIFTQDFGQNVLNFLMWKLFFLIVTFMLINIFIFIKIFQIHKIEKNLTKNTMLKGIDYFCKLKINPKDFSQLKKFMRFIIIVLNILLIMIFSISLPILPKWIKYETNKQTLEEMKFRISKYQE